MQEPGYVIELKEEVKELKLATKKSLDALEFAEAAIMDAIFDEDGLDGNVGHKILKMISKILVKHNRTSIMVESKK